MKGTDLYASSNLEICGMLGQRFRQYRKRMGYSQAVIAEKTGVSIFTVRAFERGTGTGVALGTFIALMRSIEQLDRIDDLLPEIPESPKVKYFRQLKSRQR